MTEAVRECIKIGFPGPFYSFHGVVHGIDAAGGRSAPLSSGFYFQKVLPIFPFLEDSWAARPILSDTHEPFRGL